MNKEIITFEEDNISLKVNLQDETVWLTTEQMARLFDRDYKTIRKHINNALKEELNSQVVVANFENTTQHGAIIDKKQTHLVEHYNLDMIISVGYRVKSKRGITFRKWATKVLKEHLVKGYTINQKRLEYLGKTIELVNNALEYTNNTEIKDIIKIINNYSKALLMLDNYDHNIIKKNSNNTTIKIDYNNCIKIINELKQNEQSKIFALEKNNGLLSIINDIYQTYDNKDLYPSKEEKAANFLYLLVKNHVFIDGNKRIAASLFIYFLTINNMLYKNNQLLIDNSALAALTILIAESNPKDKDIIVNIVMNCLLS